MLPSPTNRRGNRLSHAGLVEAELEAIFSRIVTGGRYHRSRRGQIVQDWRHYSSYASTLRGLWELQIKVLTEGATGQSLSN